MNKRETEAGRQSESANQHDARTQLLSRVVIQGQMRNAAMPTQALPAQTVRANGESNTQPQVDERPDKQNPIKGLFDGLSFSQVAAGALAAVTSMLLSAQIGIAGSVIGVAVGSVVSTVSSQMYKKFLSGSAEKLRDFASSDNDADAADDETDVNSAATRVMSVPNAERARIVSRIGNDAMPSGYGPAGETHALNQHMHEKPDTAAKVPSTPTTVEAAGASTPEAAAASRTPHINSAAGRTGNASYATGAIEAEVQKKRAMQRRVLAVSVASSIIAILLFAGLVSMFTAGQGIGAKVVPFTGKTVTSQLAEEPDAPQAGASGQAPEKQQPDQAATNNENPNSEDASSANSQSNNSTGTSQNSSQGSNSGGSESTAPSTGNASTSGTAGSAGATGSGNSTSQAGSVGESTSSGTAGNANGATNEGSSTNASNSATNSQEGNTANTASGSTN